MSAWQSTETASYAKRAARLLARACALLMLTGMLALLAPAQDEGPSPVPVPPQQMAQPKEPPPPAKTTLRGHVAYENNGRPVRRARVMLLNQEARSPGEKVGMTDARGDFQIKEVPEGKYYIMVDAPGLVTPISLVELEQLDREGLQSPEVGKLFETISVDGINDKQVEVRARRGGSIAGRVTYEDGDPVVNARVSVMRLKNGHPVRFLTSISPSAFVGHQTDDRGMYRFNGLPPGEYIVSASEHIEHGDARRAVVMDDDFMGSIMLGLNSFVVTYYQSATSASAATPVKIDGSEEENNIDITLAERALHSISGTVVSRTDKRPLIHARLNLNFRNGDSRLVSGMPFSEFLPHTETDELGQWSFKEIPDGDYTITVEPPYQSPEPAPGMEDNPEATTTTSRSVRKLSQKELDVKMTGHDINNLVLEMSAGARITGTVTAEGGKPLPNSLIVFAQPDGKDMTFPAQGMVGPNGRFVIDGVPEGKVYLGAGLSDTKYYVKSVMAGGTDLAHEPLMVQEGAEISNVQIVLSSEVGTLTGRLLTASGEPLSAASAYVLLYPVDQSLWNRPGHVLTGTPDARGAFTVSGQPGDYYVIILYTDEINQSGGMDDIKSRVAAAPRVRLQANEQKSMDLTAKSAK